MLDKVNATDYKSLSHFEGQSSASVSTLPRCVRMLKEYGFFPSPSCDICSPKKFFPSPKIFSLLHNFFPLLENDGSACFPSWGSSESAVGGEMNFFAKEGAESLFSYYLCSINGKTGIS